MLNERLKKTKKINTRNQYITDRFGPIADKINSDVNNFKQTMEENTKPIYGPKPKIPTIITKPEIPFTTETINFNEPQFKYIKTEKDLYDALFSSITSGHDIYLIIIDLLTFFNYYHYNNTKTKVRKLLAFLIKNTSADKYNGLKDILRYIINNNNSRSGHSSKINSHLVCFIEFLEEVLKGRPITLGNFKMFCLYGDDDDDDDEPLMPYDKDISNFTNEGVSDDANFLDGQPLHIIREKIDDTTTIGGIRQKQRKKENQRKLKMTCKNK